MNAKQNKTNYKNSPLGLIPEDWEVKQFEDVSHIDKESLKGSTSGNYEFNYVSLSDVNSDEFKIETTRQFFGTAPSRARRIVKKGDILMSTVRPNLQGFTLIKDEVNDLIASTGFAVITTKKCNNEFLFHYLFSDLINKQFYQLLVGSNYPAINSSDVKSLKLPMPPLPEQTAIANCLSTWDKAIATQTQIIAQKELRKKALANRLLTGKVRLKGFEKEKWIEKKADTLFRNNTDKSHNGELEILSASQERGIVPRSSNNIDIKYDVNSLGSYKKVEVGDYVISLRSFQGGIEYSEYEGIVSPAYTILKEIIPVSKIFYKVYFKTETFINRLNTIIYGIRDGKQIGFKDFATLKLPYPSIEEQTAIANILQCADEEIQLLKKKLQQLKDQKKGLMQVLLTGKKRLEF
jgi:type I restriction enzyme S subunit